MEETKIYCEKCGQELAIKPLPKLQCPNCHQRYMYVMKWYIDMSAIVLVLFLGKLLPISDTAQLMVMVFLALFFFITGRMFRKTLIRLKWMDIRAI